jgi:hypothetical protein
VFTAKGVFLYNLNELHASEVEIKVNNIHNNNYSVFEMLNGYISGKLCALKGYDQLS